MYSNTLAVVRQYVSSVVGDLILSTAGAPVSSTLYTDSELTKADDYYNHLNYRGYCYSGTAIGQERAVHDWVYANRNLIFTPAFSPAIVAADKFELHKIFFVDELNRAINMAIESVADGKYLIDKVDTTTVKLTSTEDNLGNIVYTYEYTLPTDVYYVDRVTTEHGVGGSKLTGTVSGAFTAGETVTGETSEATGELSYGPDGSTYIRLRKVSGTFAVEETATGGTSEETCSSITAVASETAGSGKWEDGDVIDPRNWRLLSSRKLKLHESYYHVNEDLYLRIEGQGRQAVVTSDTTAIVLPLDWLVQKAITFLPGNKIESNALDETYRRAMIASAQSPKNYPHPESRKVIE